MNRVETLLAEYTQKLTAAIRAQVLESLGGGNGARYVAKPVSVAVDEKALKAVVKKKKRKKGPIQLCPVPKCKNRAAPVFGMVCAAHKTIAKATIAKYRAARRAKKA